MTAPRGRRIAATAAMAGALLLALYALGTATREPSGPASSSYATSPQGVAAWAELLERSGHPVRRLHRAPAEATLDPHTTLVVLDPNGVPPADARAAANFVRAGGRLVTSGGAPWLRPLLGEAPGLSGRDLKTHGVLAPVPELGRARRIVAGAERSWERPGALLPALGRGPSSLLVVSSPSRGRLVALADAAPLHNRRLASADNAALALGLVGEPGRPVVFAESYHGYGAERGLAALPGRWQLALALLGVAALVWVAAHIRRFGPPEASARDVPPPRRTYVEALATTLARTRDPRQAAATLQRAASARLARRVRAGGAGELGDDGLAELARRAGLSAAEARSLSTPARDDGDVLAAARVLARLNSSPRGR